jgi:hypothetical protein
MDSLLDILSERRHRLACKKRANKLAILPEYLKLWEINGNGKALHF